MTSKPVVAINAVYPSRVGSKLKYTAEYYWFDPKPQYLPELDRILRALNMLIFNQPSHPHLTHKLIAETPIRVFRVIINPKAGKGQGMKIFERDVLPIIEASATNLIDVVTAQEGLVDDESIYQVTKKPGEAKRIAKCLATEHENFILCVGGDGTIHEVVNGLAEREDSVSAFNNVIICTVPAGLHIHIQIG
jgi:hypothetical protein